MYQRHSIKRDRPHIWWATLHRVTVKWRQFTATFNRSDT